MPKYLWKASYTTDGAKGVLKDGGSARVKAVEAVLQDLGGTLESFYFAFGEADAYVIAELPDETTATAISLAINARETTQLETIPLLTPEQVDEAAKRSVDYRPPGG
jgi:uncharacterized protein with GYD domain